MTSTIPVRAIAYYLRQRPPRTWFVARLTIAHAICTGEAYLR